MSSQQGAQTLLTAEGENSETSFEKDILEDFDQLVTNCTIMLFLNKQTGKRANFKIVKIVINR